MLVLRHGAGIEGIVMPSPLPRPSRWRLAALLLAATGAATSSGAEPAKAGPPQRIISLNLCADQYLLELADRSQIAALTVNAADPEMSAAASRAKGIRLINRSIEEILVIDPDLIVGMPARRSAVAEALKDRNIRLLDLQSAESYAEIVTQTRTAAAAIGQSERGEAIIRRMNADLAALPKGTGSGVAAYYQRRGFMTGTGTLVDDLMKRVGLTNLAARLGKPVLAHLSLEELIAAQPDWLIVESATRDVKDQGTEMLHHPALRHIPRLYLPQAWTVCGGPAYVLAARSLVEQIAAARTRSRPAP